MKGEMSDHCCCACACADWHPLAKRILTNQAMWAHRRPIPCSAPRGHSRTVTPLSFVWHSSTALMLSTGLLDVYGRPVGHTAEVEPLPCPLPHHGWPYCSGLPNEGHRSGKLPRDYVITKLNQKKKTAVPKGSGSERVRQSHFFFISVSECRVDFCKITSHVTDSLRDRCVCTGQ